MIALKLHGRLLGVARHRTAARLIDALHAQDVRRQVRTILVPGRARQSREEHRTAVDAVAARDEGAAEGAIGRRLHHGADALRCIPAAQLDRKVTLI